MKWQPIDCAPKDGTAILTDLGVVTWYASSGSENNEHLFIIDDSTGEKSFWVHCDAAGDAFMSEYGYFPCKPTVWTELPSPPL